MSTKTGRTPRSPRNQREPLVPYVMKGFGPYLIFGDVHGCLSELKTLFAEVRRKYPKFTAISVGDLVDRGPDVAGTVRFCMENDVVLVLGNHEEKLLRAKKGNPVKMQEYHQTSYDALEGDPELWEYIKKSSPFVRILDHNTIVVHGGLYSGMKPEYHNLKHIIRLRSYDPMNKRLMKPNETGGTHWIDQWFGPEFVIYGHIWRPEVEARPFSLGIDTGVVYGNKLTGVVLDRLEDGTQDVKFFQVRSEETYWTKHYEDEIRANDKK